jgi:50S ribosomal subunit-associated GTPase HflX
LTRPQTLASLPANADAVRRVNLDAKLVIAANKFDLADARQLNNEQLRSMAGELRAPFYLTSAKTGDAVETLFRHLGRLLIS